MKAVKDCQRFSKVSFFDEELAGANGELFVNHMGDIWNSQSINVLHTGLDTVEQLYHGLCRSDVYLQVFEAYQAGFNTQVNIGGFSWVVKSGKAGGYRYLLQNKHIGLNILFGSNYIDSVYSGHHLKIRCSPNFLLSRTIENIQTDLDLFASFFIFQLKHTGVAVHLACDVQGWEIPDDLDRRLVCKAKRVFRNSGIQELEYDSAGVAMVYGAGQSYTFGKRSSLQFAVYDKSKEVEETDKKSMWLPIWSQKLGADFEQLYKPEQQVARFELRFHHSVVQQFGWGIGEQLLNLEAVAKHLNGLWRYGMNNFRLDDSRSYINPFWQFLRDDMRFYHTAVLDLDYKRLYANPAATDKEISDQSLAICFGQLARIYAKNGFTVAKASAKLINSGIYENLVNLYHKRNRHEDFILLDLEEKMSKVILN